jgi:hypothetical protein
MVAVGSASVAVKVVAFPEQIEVPPVPAIGDADRGDTVTVIGVRTVDEQPFALVAAI